MTKNNIQPHPAHMEIVWQGRFSLVWSDWDEDLELVRLQAAHLTQLVDLDTVMLKAA